MIANAPQVASTLPRYDWVEVTVGREIFPSRVRVASQPADIRQRIHLIPYNIPVPIPPSIHGQKYICLITFRKTGVPVSTPVWFGEEGDKLYVMTRSDSGKYKRIRNQPRVRIAPCSIRGKIIGPEFSSQASILPERDWRRAKEIIDKKYWLARWPFWSKKNVFVTIENVDAEPRPL
jgi:PPOX class probable F420-dependent enzyme